MSSEKFWQALYDEEDRQRAFAGCWRNLLVLLAAVMILASTLFGFG